MTKEQEKTLYRLSKDIKNPLACGDITIVNIEDLETVLNMLKEKDKEIENNKKSLDNLENELNRLSERNLELFEESFEAQKKNEYWSNRIEQGKKDVKGLRIYEIGIVCEDLKEEIKMQEKQIDLMAELIARKPGARTEICHNMQCDKKIAKECKLCAKQYFKELAERKSENGN